MEIAIRQATSEDRYELLDLVGRSQLATGIPPLEMYPANQLESFLYHSRVYEKHRYVAISESLGKIVGHAVIERPNPIHVPLWIEGLGIGNDNNLAELGGAFVDPSILRQGIWTKLLDFRLEVIRDQLNASIVTSTWSRNTHVKDELVKRGAQYVCTDEVHGQQLDLFVFPT